MAQEKLWNKNNQTLSHAFRFNAFCHLTITIAFTTPLLCSYTFTMLAYKCNLFLHPNESKHPSTPPSHLDPSLILKFKCCCFLFYMFFNNIFICTPPFNAKARHTHNTAQGMRQEEKQQYETDSRKWKMRQIKIDKKK